MKTIKLTDSQYEFLFYILKGYLGTTKNKKRKRILNKFATKERIDNSYIIINGTEKKAISFAKKHRLKLLDGSKEGEYFAGCWTEPIVGTIYKPLRDDGNEPATELPKKLPEYAKIKQKIDYEWRIKQ